MVRIIVGTLKKIGEGKLDGEKNPRNNSCARPKPCGRNRTASGTLPL
ncbi:MAG: hypothetical protein L6V93_21270 [Clostridiales bacterium]|nr:MAG: hypothetical protein L6V93_21270 [Clostridiales bacterium]